MTTKLEVDSESDAPPPHHGMMQFLHLHHRRVFPSNAGNQLATASHSRCYEAVGHVLLKFYLASEILSPLLITLLLSLPLSWSFLIILSA